MQKNMKKSKRVLRAETVATLVNTALMKEDGRPEPCLKMTGNTVTTGALKGGANWLVRTIVKVSRDSVTIAVKLPHGAKGYKTNILTEFADDETITKYARHALNTIYKRNGWGMTNP